MRRRRSKSKRSEQKYKDLKRRQSVREVASAVKRFRLSEKIMMLRWLKRKQNHVSKLQTSSLLLNSQRKRRKAGRFQLVNDTNNLLVRKLAKTHSASLLKCPLTRHPRKKITMLITILRASQWWVMKKKSSRSRLSLT